MPTRPMMTTTYTLTAYPNTIVRDVDGAFIPDDPANLDYQNYLAWLDAGNEPNPYTPPETTEATAPVEDRVADLEGRVSQLEGGNG